MLQNGCTIPLKSKRFDWIHIVYNGGRGKKCDVGGEGDR